MKTFLLTIGIAAILVICALWLNATPGPHTLTAVPASEATPPVMRTPRRTTTPLAATSSAQYSPASTPRPPATSTVHSIDWLSVDPPSIVEGALTPVVITAQVADPAVIRSGVSLLYIPPTGPPTVIGTLNDAGVNGDLISNDNVFTIASTTLFRAFPPGVLNLRISAAFSGSLLRTQTSVFQLTVNPPLSTANWITLTDSQGMFSLQVPSGWNIRMTETSSADPSTVEDVIFAFPDGTQLFTISIYTTSTWASLQNGDGPGPLFLGESSRYAFGETDDFQAPINSEPVSMNEIAATLPQVLATFKILQ